MYLKSDARLSNFEWLNLEARFSNSYGSEKIIYVYNRALNEIYFMVKFGH
jgi:hypothetical protein